MSKSQCFKFLSFAHARPLLVCGFLGILLQATANASMVSGWWGGSWKCTIDGRPAQMRWSPVSDDQGSCNGGTCSSISGARWSGRFSDNGSKWVPLRDARKGNQGGLFFRHVDGNQWYLAQPVNNVSKGWTTWNGSRYPLACSR